MQELGTAREPRESVEARRDVRERSEAADRSEALLAVLSEITHAVAGTLELREVFSRVAEAVSRVLTFEAMGVIRLEDPETVELYAVAGKASEHGGLGSRFGKHEMSALLWPE
ncbi:MAG: hypothetical protein ABIT01_01175, partial [Thermoanaerobaculia bacterium]